jgi:hypothetical protein
MVVRVSVSRNDNKRKSNNLAKEENDVFLPPCTAVIRKQLLPRSTHL